ncbi:MAG: hypothetical protein AB7G80_06650 [Dongiaceae bacterium]
MEQAPGPEDSKKLPPTKMKILVVEDTEPDQEFREKLVAAGIHGHIRAHSIAEALIALMRTPFDAVVMDSGVRIGKIAPAHPNEKPKEAKARLSRQFFDSTGIELDLTKPQWTRDSMLNGIRLAEALHRSKKFKHMGLVFISTAPEELRGDIPAFLGHPEIINTFRVQEDLAEALLPFMPEIKAAQRQKKRERGGR